MSEKNLIVNNLQFSYKGIFEFGELLKVIYKSVEERGYAKHEKKHEEYVKPDGKEIYLELRPIKKKTEFFTLMVKLRITMSKIKEVDLVVDGYSRTFHQGDINIIFDCWTTTDYEGRWGQKAFYYFVRSLIDKYIYKFQMDEDYMGEGIADTKYIYNQIRSHLGLYKFKGREAEPVSKE
ncbi:hypothetical protein ACFLZB_04200 [Nanoarchaeota archaeon]